MARNVLVVSTVEDADAALRAHFAEDDTIKVVVPVIGQGVLDWLANDQKAFGHAERVAERTAERLPGETVDAVAGEADVGLAIRDALATFPADEIVIAVRPDEEEGLVESIATEGRAGAQRRGSAGPACRDPGGRTPELNAGLRELASGLGALATGETISTKQ